MTVVKIRVFGEEQFQHKMRNLVKHVYDPRDVLNDIADDMMRVINAEFTSQGRRYGGSWKHLDKDTVKEKRASFQDPRILIATGALRRSYTRRGDPNQRLRVTRSSITLGSTLRYGDYHQFGTDTIPQRKFVDFQPQDRARWARMIERR
jgi:phage gpG-like protein